MGSAPPDLDRRRVRGLLGQVRAVEGVATRIDEVSRLFVNAPYLGESLGGSPFEKEVLTVSLDGFDCVTYVEYVLALARSETPDEFVDCVRHLRYLNGLVDWSKRNHYMSDWIRSNVRAGFVNDLTKGRGIVERQRRLMVVAGLKPRVVKVRSIQKRVFLRRLSEVSNGDLIFFASTRPALDIFHCGLLSVNGRGKVRLLHASRNRGRVVEQSLETFLAANRMPGVILVRPSE